MFGLGLNVNMTVFLTVHFSSILFICAFAFFYILAIYKIYRKAAIFAVICIHECFLADGSQKRAMFRMKTLDVLG